MHSLLLTALLLTCGTLFAQPRYQCRYTDSLRLEKTPELLRSIEEAPGMENIPAAVRGPLVDRLLGKLRHRVFEITADVYADSTVLETADITESGGIRMNVRNGRQVLRGGRLWNSATGAVIDSSNYNIDPKRLKATGRSKQLLGHRCREFANADGSTVIWVAPGLPAGITPGVPTSPVAGAVLEVFVQNEKNTTHTVITDIRKL
ncbi:MAG: hypothetical protein EOO11_14350 [Chitinophagaceae bacterium]|nr:MAG: hypothetical protein EOO11_14350 [Chitinophagaceae bacterium]